MGSEAACSNVTASGIWIRLSAVHRDALAQAPVAVLAQRAAVLDVRVHQHPPPTHSRADAGAHRWTTPAISPPGMRGISTGSPGMPCSTKMSR